MESVVALFREAQQAQAVLVALQNRGFARDHLAFAMTDVVAEDTLAQATGISPEMGAPGGSGNVIRGLLAGGLAGLALTVPVWLLLLIIPSTRIYQEGGLLAMLFGALGGAGLGGLFGALTGSDLGDYVKLLRRMGVPAAQAERFYDGIKAGNILVIARDPDSVKADEALRVMRQYGALSLEGASGGGRLDSERRGQGGH
ncbi:hypothetical protein E5F05_16845 [Deinococcus metallilatus]|uniref:DUF1269 domain-containing protein n=1 Tax=Deinococcus metallilatus TaxID=1211322 RepID=A0AAJ5K5Q8_9DEIO|nr:hypothetical protein [Deinococcus metallilatus]MBB5294821.1 hypothetical protein [Deinococcus metallilatus]QBY09461.1 hypothetical protein E5F05_16845 [Deinococcus metallilatus]RXJ09466.1 hypothetical protein ERJ73_15685 [Deinococcus metallilatus]TLK28988.1 hypothetical protein FCS05_07450 [Deinococcus metallilatus]